MAEGSGTARECTKCGETKPLDMFQPSARYLDGRTRQCKACRQLATNEARRVRRAASRAAGIPRTQAQRDYEREYRINKRPALLDAQRKAKYGITGDQYRAMRTEQGNRCAICQDVMTATPHVDHCHETGAVRGLLCGHCNKAIGLLRDRPEVAERAATYLRAAALLKEIA